MEAGLHRDRSLYRGAGVRSAAKVFWGSLHLRRRWNSGEYSLNPDDSGRGASCTEVIQLGAVRISNGKPGSVWQLLSGGGIPWYRTQVLEYAVTGNWPPADSSATCDRRPHRPVVIR